MNRGRQCAENGSESGQVVGGVQYYPYCNFGLYYQSVISRHKETGEYSSLLWCHLLTKLFSDVAKDCIASSSLFLHYSILKVKAVTPLTISVTI